MLSPEPISFNAQSEVGQVRFSILSTDRIIKQSVVEITECGTSGPGTIGDRRLGAVGYTACGTCNKKTECQGHYGVLHLPIKFINPLPSLKKMCIKLLRSVCPKCSSLLIDNGRINIISDDNPSLGGYALFDRLVKDLTKVKFCPKSDCGHNVPSYVINDGMIVSTYGKGGESIKMIVTDDEVYGIFDKISKATVISLGLGDNFRPIDLIMDVLVIPPPCTRPYVRSPNGTMCEDDNTHKLSKIVSLSKRITAVIQTKARDMKDKNGSPDAEHMIRSLRFNISTMFDNTDGLSRSPNHRPTSCYKSRLSGKEGRVRRNMSGKRCNQSARSVITPGVNQLSDQVGLPAEIADVLTKPIVVNRFNINSIQENLENANFVRRGDNKPSVMKYRLWTQQTRLLHGDLVRRVGSSKLLKIDSEFILKENDVILRDDKEIKDIVLRKRRDDFKLCIGDVVDMKLADGDFVLINRQPTLGAGGIMAFRTKRVPGKTIRLPLSVTSSFNADFDGDEMNVHAPQTVAAIAEARILCSVKNNIIQEQNNAPRLCIVQDAIIASFLMSRECLPINRGTFFDFCMLGHDGVSDDANGLSIDFCLQKVKDFERVRKEHNLPTPNHGIRILSSHCYSQRISCILGIHPKEIVN